MNRITQALQNKKAFIAFVTGGDPNLKICEQIIYTLVDEGVDVIEIGIPFSDPMAEGIVIQAADERALKNGCTVDDLFVMVKRIRQRVSIPLVFMTYVNPVYTYGKDKFMRNCQSVGIDGVIVPDVPFEEKHELEECCKQYNITLISMIAPTSSERVQMIAKEAEGFLYCVSSLGVTGVRTTISHTIDTLIKQVKAVSDIPCMIGFGISTRQQVIDMSQISDGVIVGSALVKIIGEHQENCIPMIQMKIRELLGK